MAALNSHEINLCDSYLLFIQFTHVFVSDPAIKVTLPKLLNTPAIHVKIDVDELNHYIGVDIVPSLKYPLPSLGARRVRIITERLQELPRRTREVVEEDLCLVPKFDEAWKLSFSKFENNILDSFYDGNDSDDEDYDCKKDCLRYAKCRLLKWKSQSSAGLNGISSYLLKVNYNLYVCHIFLCTNTVMFK